MEREKGICPIAVLYFAINVLSWSTMVQILPQRYIVTTLGHVTSSVARP